MKRIHTGGDTRMKGKKRIKRTTLLVIGAILLWGIVAIWNEMQRSEAGLSLPRPTTVSNAPTYHSNSHTAVYPETNGLKTGMPYHENLTVATEMI
ncbi:hypothetical protein [Paenibacillus sedimenti]|uniref:Uncharacterized protein n=1 Tax=Paenibacillus sedimenti TaxID=2770274 RepID=A0A926QKR7_9BACL|nr:hypothetical protein [Paenibacillus sedimenti]MBD0381714.1 hypothetical protein [Paenibacillus sedimenti]